MRRRRESNLSNHVRLPPGITDEDIRNDVAANYEEDADFQAFLHQLEVGSGSGSSGNVTVGPLPTSTPPPRRRNAINIALNAAGDAVLETLLGAVRRTGNQQARIEGL